MSGRSAIVAALVAALLFGASTPFAKILVGELSPVLLAALLYLGSGEVLRYEPDEADLKATEVKVQALWEAIARATESGDWRPNPSRLCDWCSHRESHCPAWGGTLPPLPDLATSGSASGSAPGKP